MLILTRFSNTQGNSDTFRRVLVLHTLGQRAKIQSIVGYLDPDLCAQMRCTQFVWLNLFMGICA